MCVPFNPAKTVY
jgi:hypothetical protein